MNYERPFGYRRVVLSEAVQPYAQSSGCQVVLRRVASCFISSRWCLGLLFLVTVACGSNEPVSQPSSDRQAEKQVADPKLHYKQKYEQPLSTQREMSAGQDDTPAIRRFIEGIDEGEPEPMTADEIRKELNDPWATHVLREGKFPADVVEVLEEMRRLETRPEKPFSRRSFLVGEGGQFSAALTDLNRTFRFVVSWSQANLDGRVFLSVPAGSRNGLTELIAWDDQKQSFNFYRREGTNAWVWRGETRHAFDKRSAGQSCFACHPNGTLLMKELMRPWQNWHSELAGISGTVVPPSMRPDDIPELKALFDGKATAQHLEALVTNGIVRSNLARTTMRDGKIEDVQALFRQVLGTNNANLLASEQKAIAAGPTTRVGIPKDLFFDHRLFDRVLNVELPGFSTPIPWPRYDELSQEIGFEFPIGTSEIDGDTFFLGLVPTRAFEDSNMWSHLLNTGLVNRRFALCVSMVDFPNPVFSSTRNALLKYVESIPDTVQQDALLSAQDALVAFVLQTASEQGVVEEASLDGGTAEQQFAFYWNLAELDLQKTVEAHLRDYLDKARARSKTTEGQSDIVRLIVLRRRQFQDTLPGSEQAEFPLLFPRTSKVTVEAGRTKRDGTIDIVER